MSLHVITSMYSALSAKIPEIDRHCEQTAAYSRRIAEGMGLDETACTNAYYAGFCMRSEPWASRTRSYRNQA